MSSNCFFKSADIEREKDLFTVTYKAEKEQILTCKKLEVISLM